MATKFDIFAYKQKIKKHFGLANKFIFIEHLNVYFKLRTGSFTYLFFTPKHWTGLISKHPGNNLGSRNYVRRAIGGGPYRGTFTAAVFSTWYITAVGFFSCEHFK